MADAYLVTGTTGAGKPAVARRLADVIEGEFVELDHLVAGWRTVSGEPVDTRPDDPDENWVRSHRWCWDLQQLEQMLRVASEASVCAGYAENMEAAFDLFDRVILLTVDVATQERRLDDPERENTFAKSEAVRQLMAAHLEDFQPRLAARRDVYAVDARQPLEVVVQEIESDLERG